MSKCRSFLFVYSPIITMSFAIAGIVTMALFIGLGLCVRA